MRKIVNRAVVFILRLVAVTAIGLALFRGFQPAGELCALSIRKRWPDVWFSSFAVWNADFLALVFSIIIAVVVVQFAFKRLSKSNPPTT